MSKRTWHNDLACHQHVFTMNIIDYYGFCFGGSIVFLTLFCLISFTVQEFLRLCTNHLSSLLPKQARANILKWGFRIFGSASIAMVVVVVIIGGNIAAAFSNGTQRPGLRDRFGTVTILNMLPLYAGTGVKFIERCFGVPKTPYENIHRWLGIVTVCAALGHALLALSSERISLGDPKSAAGLVVSC